MLGLGITSANANLSAGADAIDYFVDSIGGSDANSGTSPSAPFAGLAKAFATASAGDHIALKRGAVFATDCYSNLNDITLSAYGAGAAPLVRADDDISNAAFTQNGTYSNLYDVSIFTAPAITEAWINVLEDGVMMATAASLADCDATPGSYYVADHTTGGSQTLSIHPAGGADPATSGRAYSHSARHIAIYLEGNNVTVNGIDARMATSPLGTLILAGTGGVLRGCRAAFGGKHNVYISGDGVVENCLIEDGNWQNPYTTMLVGYDGAGGGRGLTFSGNTIRVSSGTPLRLGAIYFHTDGGPTQNFGAVVIKDNRIENCSSWVDGRNAPSMSIEDCTVIDCEDGYFFIDATVRRLQFKGSANVGSAISARAANVSVTVEDSTFCEQTVQRAVVDSYLVWPATITLTNSDFYLTSGISGWPRAHVFMKGGTLSVTGCTFHDDFTGNGTGVIAGMEGETVTYTGDNNHFVGIGAGELSVNINGSDYTSLAALRAGTGQDSNSDAIGDASGACAVT